MIKTCYSPKYYAETPTTSMKKLPIIAEMVEKEGLAELIDPGSIDPKLLNGSLHSVQYVDAFIKGEYPLCSSQGFPWTKEIRDGVLSINAGQLVGARLALENRITANIAQGFHHASQGTGCGYCTFNGLALVAKEFSDLKVGVLDCDEHFGNGTADFARTMKNLFTFSIFGSPYYVRREITDNSSSICVFDITENFDKYVNCLNFAMGWLKSKNLDLIIYQAGVDVHIDDPYGFTMMTTEQFIQRDNIVFNYIKELGIPVLFVMAGGYQEDIRGKLAPLHVNTFRVAKNIYYS